MIISQTPFRISFFGGGTDFPEYFREHGGSVIATAINKYAYLSVHSLGPFFKYCIKANYSQTETVDHPEQIKHPLIRESLVMLNSRSSLEISHIADLPGRTGIGSSSSFTVGLLNALHHMKGDVITPEDLAREAIMVERDRVKDAGGHQDQYAAAYGGFIRVDFGPGQHTRVERLAIPGHRLEQLNERLMIFYSGTEQSAETILTEQKKNTQINISSLKEMRQMVDRAEEILCGEEDLDQFGSMLHESWMRKRSLAKGISNSVIDQHYDTALKHGALGGKLLGAGGRGFLLVYANPAMHSGIRNALKGLQEVDFKFSPHGSRIIFRSEEE